MKIGNRHRQRNIAIGAITLLIVCGLLIVGVANKRRQAAEERQLLHRADLLTVKALAGQCALYAQAEALYKQAMRFHLQDRDLVGRASLCATLSGYCGQDVRPLLITRLHLLTTGNAQPDDIKAVLELQLAAGDRQSALTTTARYADDPYSQWLGEWLRELPAPGEE
ncbi:MAG TPA: hypothetical protein PKW95_21420 [bacterium]|nr:hypothetical protein [bacterium]